MTEEMRAVIYAAKSTEDKHGSIGTQLEDGRALAGDMEVVGEFTDEAFSGYHGNRGPGLAQAMAMCEANAPCALIVQHSDRLARGDARKAKHLVEYAVWARQQAVQIMSVQDPQTFDPRGLVYTALMGDRNTEDSERKAKATRDGLKRRKAKGKPVGPVPFGFKVEKVIVDGELITKRVVDPDEEPVVVDVFERHASGMSTGEVARRLNEHGHKTMRGKAWSADAVRWMLENDSYVGTKGYAQIVSEELARRARAQLRRADPAATQRRRGGRPAKEPSLLRGFAFCTCGAPLYAIAARGERPRRYVCRNVVQSNGLCSATPIPAVMADERVLEHLRLFIGDVGEWIGDRLSERSDAQKALRNAVDAEKAKLVVLDRQREDRMAELESVGFNAIALEVIERIDRQREAVQQSVEDAQARLNEWTVELAGDAVLAYYEGIVDVVQGRIAKAEGVREINAALHESLTGIWLSYDGRTLKADIKLRPTGDEDIDQVLAEMFPALEPDPHQIEFETLKLADSPR